MGKLISEEIVELLCSNGIRAEIAYPGGEITRITSVVAAVSVHEVDQKNHTLTVLVDVLCPQQIGGYSSQTKAMEVCELLKAYGAVCRQGKCAFVKKASVFRVPVWAEFHGVVKESELPVPSKYKIKVGGMELRHLSAFSAEKKVNEPASFGEAKWTVTVEEFFPWGTFNTLEPEEPFELDVISKGGLEQYLTCSWVRQKRIAEEMGVRQIREAVAKNRLIEEY